MELSKLKVVVFILLKTQVTDMLYTNIALHKPTLQVSTRGNYLSSKGVDGSRSAQVGSCTYTHATSNTWWIVDLLHVYDVHLIRILNRKDFSDILTGFYIYVSMVNPLPLPPPDQNFTGQLCVNHSGTIPPNGPHSLYCDHSIRGRYVYVWKPENGALTLCEVIVPVEETKREMQCPVSFGQKSALTPVHWEYVQPASISRCFMTCLFFELGAPSYAQIDKRSGRCECIFYSDLLTASPQISQDENFDLCNVTDLLSVI